MPRIDCPSFTYRMFLSFVQFHPSRSQEATALANTATNICRGGAPRLRGAPIYTRKRRLARVMQQTCSMFVDRGGLTNGGLLFHDPAAPIRPWQEPFIASWFGPSHRFLVPACKHYSVSRCACFTKLPLSILRRSLVPRILPSPDSFRCRVVRLARPCRSSQPGRSTALTGC